MPNLNDIAKRAAALLGFKNLVALAVKLCSKTKTPAQQTAPNLIGSIKIKTDNLEAASRRIADSFAKSRDETIAKL